MNTSKFSKAFNRLGSEKKTRLNRLDSHRPFNENSNKLEAKTTSQYRFYDKWKTIESQHLKSYEFTNFFNEGQLEDADLRLGSIVRNPDKLKSGMVRDYEVTVNSRIQSIFLSYIDKVDFKKYKQEIIKFTILDSFQNPTKYRLFLYLEINPELSKNSYVIFLIDPHHLVIPDKETRDKKTYQHNKNNTISLIKLLDSRH